ncbi:IstB-like ATP binding protein [[Clostridium] polysaccharolyticum]|uniref:IstB-like ATP binding protein n=1 Tax=[Clostridium] polysaccharolyticum TaxID=29364 RepID=A0A1I0A7H0_9FIRM|nr:IstB-like ATP binding protein [[Clostridium] polysaccharolyticum]
MIKATAFPFAKELKDYGFAFQPIVNKQEMRELASLGFLEKNENIVFLGPSRVGKPHLGTAIGIAAAKKRVSTYFIMCLEKRSAV